MGTMYRGYYFESEDESEQKRDKKIKKETTNTFKEIKKEFPESLEELHSILIEFKESQKNK